MPISAKTVSSTHLDYLKCVRYIENHIIRCIQTW